MNHQPKLLEIPKRKRPIRPLSLFKKKWGIWTCRTKDLTREQEPWTALLLEGTLRKHALRKIARELEKLEDRGVIVHGATETEAIEKLCAMNGLTFRP